MIPLVPYRNVSVGEADDADIAKAGPHALVRGAWMAVSIWRPFELSRGQEDVGASGPRTELFGHDSAFECFNQLLRCVDPQPWWAHWCPRGASEQSPFNHFGKRRRAPTRRPPTQTLAVVRCSQKLRKWPTQ